MIANEVRAIVGDLLYQPAASVGKNPDPPTSFPTRLANGREIWIATPRVCDPGDLSPCQIFLLINFIMA